MSAAGGPLQMEEKIFVAKLLRYFTFESSETTTSILKMSEMILRPQAGIPVRATPRRPAPTPLAD